VTEKHETIVVEKNRGRALGALAIVSFMLPASIWLLLLGFQPGRPDMSWALVTFGAVGLLAFAGSAAAIIHTMRAPWRLELSQSHLTIYAPTYDLTIGWNQILGIGVDKVDRRLGCVLAFEDVAGVVRGASFHGRNNRPSAVTDAAVMQARMEENYNQVGYHLGIPGRLLELPAEALAELLSRGRTGQLWQEGEKPQ
jgi:hypothetical protein